ncbi:MAG: hypothetical protein H7839_12985 [Magnetococcus sp. YQC-5]
MKRLGDLRLARVAVLCNQMASVADKHGIVNDTLPPLPWVINFVTPRK